MSKKAPVMRSTGAGVKSEERKLVSLSPNESRNLEVFI